MKVFWTTNLPDISSCHDWCPVLWPNNSTSVSSSVYRIAFQNEAGLSKLLFFLISQTTRFVASSPSSSCAMVHSDTICSQMALRVFGGRLQVAFDHSHRPSPLWYFSRLVTSDLNENYCLWPSNSSFPPKDSWNLWDSFTLSHDWMRLSTKSILIS